MAVGLDLLAFLFFAIRTRERLQCTFAQRVPQEHRFIRPARIVLVRIGFGRLFHLITLGILEMEVEHGTEVGRNDVLLQLGKAHALTWMASCSPANKCVFIFLVLGTIWEVASRVPLVWVRKEFCSRGQCLRITIRRRRAGLIGTHLNCGGARQSAKIGQS